MTFSIYSKGWVFLLLMFWANLSFAHSLAHEPHSSHAKPTRLIDTPSDQATRSIEQQVMELVNDYSINGDDAVLAKGWVLLKPLMEEPTPQVWLLAAWLAQAEHRFELARRYVHRVLQVQPRNPQAWMLEAAVATVMGDYDEAQKACRNTALHVAPVVSLACQLRAEQNVSSRTVLLSKVSRLRLDALDDATAAWVLSVRGDAAFASEDYDTSAKAYLRSLRLHASIQSHAALADAWLVQNEFLKVLDLLEKYQEVPALGVRYLIAARRAGQNIDYARTRLDQRFKSWILHNDYRHAREMAMFYLDVLPNRELATKLAIENARVQKEAEDRALLSRLNVPHSHD